MVSFNYLNYLEYKKYSLTCCGSRALKFYARENEIVLLFDIIFKTRANNFRVLKYILDNSSPISISKAYFFDFPCKY